MSDTLAVGRIGWWRFTNGDLTDQSGNGRDLVCFGSQIPSAVDKDGIADNAINMFTYRYYKTNDLTHPLFEVSEWSICMWVNFRNLVDVEGFLTIYSDGGGYYGAWFADSSSSMRVNGTSITRPQNGWHFIIWERLSTGFCRFYIDGVAHNISQSLSIPANSNDLVFGKRSSIPYTFPNADFDEISMYSRVLTAEEKTELFTRGVNYTATPITVISSLPSGTYTAPQAIELSCATEEYEIRYLAYNKGEEPAIEDVEMNVVYNLYSEPFEVADDWNVVVYAQVWKDGVAISEVARFEYNILEETEEEEDMKEIMLGLIFLKLRVVGTTEWTEIGDSKTEAKFKYEEKFADVKTVESGNVDKVLESTTASLEVGISQLSKALIDKLSASINSVTEGIAPDEITYLEGGAGIGTVATKYEIIAHPIEEGTGTEYDVYLPKATIETSIDKTGKAGDQLVFNLKIEGLYDREQKCKFRIGKNPA